ncbi:TPA: hypothetical protein ACGUP1_004630 [Vibrio vulnificus]|uniref:hypothetical protein n=1 Tax=Vibrio vulnificus TaxID=672 RepID=UPI001A245E82|nr:hypothetical protein [Vibrio vulnificus]MCJ0806990.1 hypothetical protein [Vibrio vulnificus]HAS6168109.1 hypothetical protein [Vibrio vulnificus]HAU8262099.1 hypothetical protein [Vibrio vulnificus]HDY7531216.1 hypothetical protein [Vibrio vulnificus]
MIRQIIEELRSGTPLTWLSFFSNILTILGISASTLVAAPLMTKITGREFDTVEFLWATIFVSIYALLVARGLFGLGSFCITQFKGGKTTEGAFSIVGLLLFVTVAVSLYDPAKNVFASVSGNSYFLPDRPAQVEAKFNRVRISEATHYGTVTGNISFARGADPSDYSVSLYTLSELSGQYVYTYFGGERKDIGNARLNSKGDFTLPKVEMSRINEAYLALFLFEDRQNSISQFPSGLNQMPSHELESLGAVVYKMSDISR